MSTLNRALTEKMSAQVKIADLERRVLDLEAWRKGTQPSQRTVTTTVQQATEALNLEPQMSRIWQSFDDLFEKIFHGKPR